MTTACPCFGRNANCRLCCGSGLITSEVETKVAISQKTRVYSGQTEAQKARDAAQKLANDRAANVSVKYMPSAAEEKAANAASRAILLADADEWSKAAAAAASAAAVQFEEEIEWQRGSKARAAAAVELAEKLARDGNFKAMPGADLATVNLRRREMKVKLEANLDQVLKAKRAGLVRTGPYRCNRCQWIHERATGPCDLCGASDDYTEAV